MLLHRCSCGHQLHLIVISFSSAISQLAVLHQLSREGTGSGVSLQAEMAGNSDCVQITPFTYIYN